MQMRDRHWTVVIDDIPMADHTRVVLQQQLSHEIMFMTGAELRALHVLLAQWFETTGEN